VAESSLRKDRLIKAKLYAQAHVPDYWIVDLTGRSIEVYRQPRRGAYTDVTRYPEGKSVPLVRFPDVRVRVSAILPNQ
jgi:Uma2 family endonuclease